MGAAVSWRDEVYAFLRADRLRRGGKPEPNAELVERDALASSRLAGIEFYDAHVREWYERMDLRRQQERGGRGL